MNLDKTIAVFGCKSNSRFLVNGLLEQGVSIHLITLSPTDGKKNKVADYTDLAAYYAGSNLPVYTVESYSLNTEADRAFFTAHDFDLAFVNGWQRLVPPAILDTFSTGVFGMHGSSENLPRGRGRSPLNWSLIEGRKIFHTNLFRYDAGVDSGKVLDTYTFDITAHDTAETLHFKNTLAMRVLVNRNLNDLRSGNFTLRPQPDYEPTYYPKRTEADSLIDWSTSLTELSGFIRAVTKPFNGAYTFGSEGKVIIYRANTFDSFNFGYGAAPSGRVVVVFPNGKFLVRCTDGLLLVHEYAGTVTEGDEFHDGDEVRKVFLRTAAGGFAHPGPASPPTSHGNSTVEN